MRSDQPEPFGFGNCGRTNGPLCPYYKSGPARTCWSCAQRSITRPTEPSCAVCARLPQPGSDVCRNRLCRHASSRYFRRVYAIGFDEGWLAYVLRRYKANHGWSPVLARLLLGWLDEAAMAGLTWDVIVGMPHAPRERGRDYDPMMIILQAASADDVLGFYAFDDDAGDPIIVKNDPTGSMRDADGIAEREVIAADQLYPSLEVRRPLEVDGRAVLVVDDVMTSGHSINQVARRLTEAGATEVDGLVFARRT